MEAMKIRGNREAPGGSDGPGRPIVHLVALAGAAVIWLGTSSAFAQPTTVTPAGQGFTATASSTAPATKVSFTLGSVTVTCNSSTTGMVPPSPNNQNPSGPVCGPIAPPTFTSCSSSLGTPTATASGAWTFCVQNAAPSTGTLIIPQNGVKVRVKALGGLVTCSATAAPAGPFNVTGTWTNGTPSTLAFSSVSVPVSASGDFPCPSGTTSSFKGTYTISPNISVAP